MKKTTLSAAEDLFIPTVEQANKRMDEGNYSYLDEFVATFQNRSKFDATSVSIFRENLEGVVSEAFLQGAKEEEIKCSNKLDKVDDDAVYLAKWKNLSYQTCFQVMTGQQLKKHGVSGALFGWCEIPEALINFKG